VLARVLALCLVGLALAGCGGDDSAPPPDPNAPRAIDVTSPEFGEGGAIPAAYTCRGDGSAPDVAWTRVPSEAGAVALVVDDPDAPGGDYFHWVVMNLPAGGVGGIDAGVVPGEATELEGSGGPGWTPPCPPSGTHRYRFTVYALPADETFAVEGGTVRDFVSVIAGEAIAWGRLTGTVTAD